MSIISNQLWTAEDLAALDFGDMRSELIEGIIHTMPPTFEDHGEYTMQLSIILGRYVVDHQLGKLYAAETGFLLARNPDTVRAPDIAFIQKDRLPALRPQRRWVPVVPDLAVEVVSSSDRPADIREKAEMWLKFGVRLVWVVLPDERAVDVYRANQPTQRLDEQATLSGEDVVPGFSTAVEAIFGA